MYYILFYKTVSDYIDKRSLYREEHLAMATKAKEDGHLVLGGALSEPADSAVLVFKVDSPEIVEAFANNDPYVRNGLISEWQVRPWNVVVGGV
ncbi:MAG TPA: YciI-like protein [Flavisolibacter sp.]|nr:YciI-like protein [Flavisolibacter sp.]